MVYVEQQTRVLELGRRVFFFFPEAAQEPLSPERSSQLLKSLLCHDLRGTFSLSPCKSKPMPLPFTCGFPQSSRASLITVLSPFPLKSPGSFTAWNLSCR